jgi:cytochrome c
MAGPGPSFSKGRLVLVFFGLAVGAIAAWLLVRSQPEPVPVVVAQPEAPEQPIAFYLARADIARGETYFQHCAACHTIREGGPHGVGPNLWGAMGSPLASRPGFTLYSSALRQRGGNWDWETASRFLRSPRDFLPGTRMAFYGVTNPQDRADLLLYLNQQGGTLSAPAGVR